MLIGIAVLSFGSRELGWSAIFLMGLSADLVASGRFGLLTVCYLLAAGAITLALSRELNRSDFGLPSIACVAATAMGHGLYCSFGSLLGLNIGLGRAAGETLSLTIASLVWCVPVIYVTGKLMYTLRVMSPEVQARWANDARMSDAHSRMTM